MYSDVGARVSPSVEELRMPPPETSYNPSLFLGVQDEQVSSLLLADLTRFSPVLARSVKLVVTQFRYKFIVATRSLWRAWNSKIHTVSVLLVLLIQHHETDTPVPVTVATMWMDSLSSHVVVVCSMSATQGPTSFRLAPCSSCTWSNNAVNLRPEESNTFKHENCLLTWAVQCPVRLRTLLMENVKEFGRGKAHCASLHTTHWNSTQNTSKDGSRNILILKRRRCYWTFIK